MISLARIHIFTFALAVSASLSATANAGCKVHYDEDFDAMFPESVGECSIISAADRVSTSYYDEDVNDTLFDVSGSRADTARKSPSGMSGEDDVTGRATRFYDEDLIGHEAL